PAQERRSTVHSTHRTEWSTSKKRKCITEGCGKEPSFGLVGTKTAEYCTQHAPDGMDNVTSRMCRTDGCGKYVLFAVAGTGVG
ncbi:unnamed protein product, partial [Ascophyllum nodosum]